MHFSDMGGTEVMHNLGASWFAREHNIKYLSPAFEGEEIIFFTWVANLQRARSMRRYMFVRKSDNKTLVTGETDWVFVDAKTGRPKIIPSEIKVLFTPIAEENIILNP
jgi:acyl-CoA thioester hydrolase